MRKEKIFFYCGSNLLAVFTYLTDLPYSELPPRVLESKLPLLYNTKNNLEVVDNIIQALNSKYGIDVKIDVIETEKALEQEN